MFTAIKQAAKEYVNSEYEKIYELGDYEHERMEEYALSSAEFMTMEIIKIVLEKHPHLRKVFDDIEKDLAWKEHNK